MPHSRSSFRPSFVLFGHSGLLGDYAETIHAKGERLKAIVVNHPDRPVGRQKPLAMRIKEIDASLGQLAGWPAISIVELSEFEPEPGQRYSLGFRSKAAPDFAANVECTYGIVLESLVHPSAVIGATSRIGRCVAVQAGAVVAAGCDIGDYCVINRGATIGHDCILGTSVNIGPGANIASNVRIAKAAAVGIGANVIENIDIGKGAFVAAGSVVTKNVSAGTLVAGGPAREIRKQDIR